LETTGLRITTISRGRTRTVTGSRGLGCRRAWRASPGCTRWAGHRDPDRAATARRHHVEVESDMLLAVLRAPALRQAATLHGAYAAVVAGQVGIIAALNELFEDCTR